MDTGRMMHGLRLRGSGCIDIRTPCISVRSANDDGVATIAYTGRFQFNCVESIRDIGNGAISWVTVTHNIDIVNGLITAIA